MAWLNQTPEKGDKPRHQMYSEESPYRQLPTLTEYEQLLVGFWHEVGLVSQTSGGVTGLAWCEIVTWADRFYSERGTEYVEECPGVFVPKEVNECELQDYELRLIRQLSLEYAGEFSAATAPARPCPKDIDLEALSDEIKLAESNALGEALMSMFGGKQD